LQQDRSLNVNQPDMKYGYEKSLLFSLSVSHPITIKIKYFYSIEISSTVLKFVSFYLCAPLSALIPISQSSFNCF